MSNQITAMLIVIANTLCVYVFLVVSMRVLSRRQLGQLTALDLLILILLGSAVETAMVHGSTLLRAGFVSATTLFVANRIISGLVAKSRKLSRICGAGPILLVHNGQFVEEHLKRIGLTHEDVIQAIRAREHEEVSEVRYAVLEPDGEINIVGVD
jgi:uncharacterized membrane protein YcaP (DUF421 family)